MSAPILIGCAHGTRDPAGQATIQALLESVRAALPDVDVREAFVDVHGPFIADVVAELPRGEARTAVVVPLLLAGGYHVHVDIAKAIADRPDIVAASALGPDPRLVAIVLDHLKAARVPADATVVLAAAGSSDARSQADTAATADLMRLWWHGPVRVGFAAGQAPSVADAVAEAVAYGEDIVAVGSYLLAPGYFQSKIEKVDALVVTAPLAPDARLVEIIVDRYRAGCEL